LPDSSRDRVALVVAWLIVAVPAAAILLFAAWISSYKLGVNGGIAYAVALAVWAGLLLWRSRHG
jgi:hypothetical protein